MNPLHWIRDHRFRIWEVLDRSSNSESVIPNSERGGRLEAHSNCSFPLGCRLLSLTCLTVCPFSLQYRDPPPLNSWSQIQNLRSSEQIIKCCICDLYSSVKMKGETFSAIICATLLCGKWPKPPPPLSRSQAQQLRNSSNAVSVIQKGCNLP